MRNGSDVIIAKEKIITRANELAEDLNSAKVSIILILCNGSFPPFESLCLVLQPQQTVIRCVESLISREHHLGIIIPIPEQE